MAQNSLVYIVERIRSPQVGWRIIMVAEFVPFETPYGLFCTIYRCNILEEPLEKVLVDENGLRLQFRPFEIVSLLLQVA